MSRVKRKRLDPIIRVRVPDKFLPLPKKGFLVCSGVGLKPWRRCHWKAVVVYKRIHAAEGKFWRLNADAGRAILDLSNPRLHVINEQGQEVTT